MLSLASVPVDIVVTPDDPAWRIVLDVLIAAGTIGAAVAAWWAASRARDIAEADRKEADRRAQEDRAAANRREEVDRSYDNLRYRLDHLVAIAEAREEHKALSATTFNPAVEADRNRAAGILRARLSASADLLPAVKADLSEQAPNLAVVTDIIQRYPDLLPADHSTELLRGRRDLVAHAELYGRIRDVRTELLAQTRPLTGGDIGNTD